MDNGSAITQRKRGGRGKDGKGGKVREGGRRYY